MNHSKAEKEKAALAARAAAQAHLKSIGQLPSSGGTLASETKRLLASSSSSSSTTIAQIAAGLLGNANVAQISGGATTTGEKSPNGWEQVKGGYWVHTSTCHAQWADPSISSDLCLPKGWMVAESNGVPYYYSSVFMNSANVEGNLVTWDKPTSPPHI